MIQEGLLRITALGCLVVLCGPQSTGAESGTPAYPVDPISMRLELEVGAARYYVGENFPITVRIANPNGFDVYLAGFDFGALEPHTEIAFPGQAEFEDFSLGGTISAFGGPPVLVPARGRLEDRRLVYSGTKLDMGHWVLMSPGVYRLRMRSTAGAVSPGESPRYTGVDWTSEEIQLTLISPSGPDLLAFQFLGEKARQLAQHMSDPDPNKPDVTRLQLSFWREFLERYADTVYAPEIRWRAAKLLLGEIGGQWSPLYNDREMIDLWEKCLTFCLGRDGAYAEAFVKLRKDEVTNDQMDLAEQFHRFDLLKKVIAGIDRKYPEDGEGILYRRAIIAGETESPAEARKLLESLLERFPAGFYSKHAQHLKEGIDRGTWPRKRE